MSRLLFAAARGARIDVMGELGWMKAYAVRTTDDFYNYRIHPSDEHLQYGPISTALRAIADEYAEDPAYGYVARKFADWENNNWITSYASILHRSLFLLILAESLADEGL